jgi:hypothetical integral membrane protein (TIGR02206 family)
MPPGLHIFGLVHLAILASVPALAALLAAAQRRFPSLGIRIRWGLSLLLIASSVSYYASFVLHGVPLFPNHLPLELCDISLWLVIAALLTLNPLIFDIVYYLALAGASMSLLTPDLWHPSIFMSIQFFVDHGLIVLSVLYLVWSRRARPRPGSVLKAMLAINAITPFVGTFDYLFQTDYMFLRAKPPTVSLLTVLGPWPWYILACEGVALSLFLLLYLPFRRASSKTASPGNGREDHTVQLPT